MTLETTQNRISYAGNGSTTGFAFPYKFLEDSDLKVILRDASGVETEKTLTTHYTVTGAEEDGGGTVTMLTAPATGESLTIIREPAETQDLDLVENDPLPAEELEKRLDKSMMVQQRALDKIDRAVRLTDGLAETFDTELPTVLTPSTLLGINAAGDGFALVAPTSLTFNDTVINVADYGAVGDGTTDDAVALTAAAAAALATGKTLYGLPGKTYRIESNVTMRRIHVDFSACTVLCVGATTRLVIGGYSQNAPNPTQRFYQIYRNGGVNGNCTCRVIGAKGQSIYIMYCDYLELYADTAAGDSGTDTSIAYSTFYLDNVAKLVLTTNMSTPNSSVQWINENTFFLKRTATLLIEGTYEHNGNMFYTGCFEGSATITVSVGSSNVFFGPRFEGGGAVVTFGAATYDNQVYGMWSSNEDVSQDWAPPATVVDPSGRNFCDFLLRAYQKQVVIMDCNPHVCEVYSANTGGARANYTTLKGVDVQRYGIDNFSRNTFGEVYASPKIPVIIGDTIKFDADVALFRPTVTLYTTAGVRMTEATHPSIATYLDCNSGLAWNNSTDAYEQSANTNRMKATVRSTDVGFVKWDMIMGNSTTGVAFTRMALSLWTKNVQASNLNRAFGNRQQPAAVSASPTVGFAKEVGTKVSKTTGGWFTNLFALDTPISVAAIATDTSITVTTVTGITSGDIVGLELDNGAAHWTTVNGAPSGNVVTLTDAVPSGAAIGKRAVFNRWTAT